MAPTVHVVDGVSIRIRTQEGGHSLPHFHVIGPDFNISIAIGSFEILAGTNSKSAKKAMAWAKQNRAILEDMWRKCHG